MRHSDPLRGKRAVREVGTAMGLTQDTIAELSSQLWGVFTGDGLQDDRRREIALTQRTATCNRLWP